MRLATVKQVTKLFEAYASVPSSQELMNLDTGNFVRLRTEKGSYFWAEVLSRQGERLVCRLDDTVNDLKRGTTITCEPCHVLGSI